MDEDDVEVLVVSPPCMDLGRSYLPRVLDLLTLLLKIKKDINIYICIFREIKIEFSKALYTKICPYLEGFWSMKDCFGTGWYSLWWFLDPPLVTGLNARTGTWLLSGSFAYKKERYISVIFKKSLCQKLVKSYCNSISRNFLFYSRDNF